MLMAMGATRSNVRTFSWWKAASWGSLSNRGSILGILGVLALGKVPFEIAAGAEI